MSIVDDIEEGLKEQSGDKGIPASDLGDRKRGGDLVEGALTNDLLSSEAFNKQCILLSLADVLAEKNKNFKDFYENFVIVEGNELLTVSRFLSTKGVRELLNLETAQLAHLVPRLKIFKSYRDVLGAAITDQEFVFSSSNTTTAHLLRDRHGYSSGVGISDFSWEFSGGDPGQKEFVSATLTLVTNSFEELEFKHFPDESSRGIAALDLIRPRDFPVGQREGRTEATSGNYQIKVQVGWDGRCVPKTINYTKFTSDTDIDTDFLSNFYMTFFLNLHDYDLSLEENGQIKLELNYFGSIDLNFLNEYSDLLASPELQKIKAQKERIQADLVQVEEELEVKNPHRAKLSRSQRDLVDGLSDGVVGGEIPELGGPLGQKVGNGVRIEMDVTALRKSKGQLDLEESLVLQEIAEGHLRDERYKRILKNIYDKERVFYINVENEKVFEKLDIGGLPALQREIRDQVASGAVKIQTYKGNSPILNEIDFQTRKKNAEKRYKVDGDNAVILGESVDLIRDKSIQNTQSSVSFTKQLLSDISGRQLEGKTTIDFIFYGDIVESCITILKKSGNPIYTKTQVLLGNASILFGGKKTVVSIADIPISVELFNQWYVDVVISRDLKSYYFRDFLRDSIQYLIPNAIKECLPSEETDIGEVDFSYFTMSKEFTDNFLRISRETGGRLDVGSEHILGAIQEAKKFNASSSGGEYNDFVLINASRSGTPDRKYDIEEDFKNGVYYLFVNNERGIVRSMNFNKVTDSQIRASNSLRANNEPAQDILEGYYDADVEMMGNTLFVPGSLVYLNPTFGGTTIMTNLQENDSPVPRSRARGTSSGNLGLMDLNLGGYYFVTKVNSQISSGRFITKIVARWVHGVEDTGKFSSEKKGEKVSSESRIEDVGFKFTTEDA